MAGQQVCPCRAGTTPALLYSACCKPFHDGALPDTTEKLMRSRYSAFALRDAGYLLATHWPVDNSPESKAELLKSFADTVWLGLDVVASSSEQVEFVAKYIANGQYGELRECSQFKRINSKWYYVDGVISES